MISQLSLGTLTLNLSFLLYLFLYFPQILHNRKDRHIKSLSLGLHYLLLTGYVLDLFYGFSRDLQWQYKTVSLVCLFLILIQHLQIMQSATSNRIFRNCRGFVSHSGPRPSLRLIRRLGLGPTMEHTTATPEDKQILQFKPYLNLFCLMLTISAIIYFFSIKHGRLSEQTTLILGYISRACFLLYCLPQIIKNNRSKTKPTGHQNQNYHQALSLPFLYLSLTLSVLDLISAWCLDFGWPNKLAAPFSIGIVLVLLKQAKQDNCQHTLKSSTSFRA